MTGRHAAPPDEAFDQLERDRAGSHRADVDVPQAERPVAESKVVPAVPARKSATPKTPKRASKS